MSKTTEETFIGTHARLLISDWKVIAELISKHSSFIKSHFDSENKSADEEIPNTALPHVLSRREIEEAINGPLQAFFKEKLSAYMKISLLRMYITLREDDTLKDYRADLPDFNKIPQTILQNTSLSDLKKIQQNLDALTIEHAEAWENARKEWNQTILQRLNEQKISFSDIEIKEFLDPEPISELFDRFTDLNIALPKLRKSDMNSSQYLTLKSDIAIQSSLSRQHISHGQADIQKTLSKLKSDFNAIAKQEKQMIEEQKKTTQEVIANISW